MADDLFDIFSSTQSMVKATDIELTHLNVRRYLNKLRTLARWGSLNEKMYKNLIYIYNIIYYVFGYVNEVMDRDNYI